MLIGTTVSVFRRGDRLGRPHCEAAVAFVVILLYRMGEFHPPLAMKFGVVFRIAVAVAIVPFQKGAKQATHPLASGDLKKTPSQREGVSRECGKGIKIGKLLSPTHQGFVFRNC
jgi:hypothetical protein